MELTIISELSLLVIDAVLGALDDKDESHKLLNKLSGCTQTAERLTGHASPCCRMYKGQPPSCYTCRIHGGVLWYAVVQMLRPLQARRYEGLAGAAGCVVSLVPLSFSMCKYLSGFMALKKIPADPALTFEFEIHAFHCCCSEPLRASMHLRREVYKWCLGWKDESLCFSVYAEMCVSGL